MTSRFRYLIFGDKTMNKSVYSWLLNYFNFLMTIVTASKINWNYYCIYLMIIHAFYEMLSHIFCNKSRVPSHIIVSRTELFKVEYIANEKPSKNYEKIAYVG